MSPGVLATMWKEEESRVKELEQKMKTILKEKGVQWQLLIPSSYFFMLNRDLQPNRLLYFRMWFSLLHILVGRLHGDSRGHGSTVVTHSPPMYEVKYRLYVEKLVVVC